VFDRCWAPVPTVLRLWDATPRIAVLRNADAGLGIGPGLIDDTQVDLVIDGLMATLTPTAAR